jgi:N-acetylneuraminic acid mutarotase
MKKYILVFYLILFCFCGIAGEWKWKPKASYPGTPRHRAIGTSVGNKGYLGLGHINSGASGDYYDWWEFDPATNSWAQKSDYPGVGRYGCSSFVINNKIYIGTGNAQGFGSQNDFYEYNPITNIWIQKANFPVNMDGGVGFAINGKGYFGGSFAATTFMQYDPNFNTWTPSAFTVNTSGEYGAAFVINNKAYFLPGNDVNFYEFDPATSLTTQKTSFPGVSRFGTGFASINNLGYVMLGADAGYNDLGDSYVYDPSINSWDTMKSFPGGKRHYVASFSIDNNKIFVGTGSNGTNLSDFWEYAFRPSNTTIGVNEVCKFNFQIYPNPTSDVLNYYTNGTSINTLEVLDFSGKIIKTEKVENVKKGTINIIDLRAGVYFLRINEGNNSQLIKFIKTN